MNLLKKLQLFQYIILLIFLYRKKNKKDTYISDDEVKNIKSITSDERCMDNFDYFYTFRSQNLLVYFCKNIETNEHIIYFDGIHKIKEFIDFYISKISKNNDEFINNILYSKGELTSLDDSVSDSVDIYDVLNIIKETHYDKPDIIKIYGYSLGGVFSQYFVENIKDTGISFNIINIESWFEKSKCLNIYNKKSLMYILRNINDPAMFFNIDYENVDEEYLSNNYFLNIFPCGIINFFIDQHSMSFNMENVVPLSI
jgi:hypothetical protein